MKQIIIYVSLFLILFLTACSAEEKVEINKVEIAMIEMGNDIGFKYLRSDASPEIIEAQILATVQNMETLQDSIDLNKSDVIRKVRIDEIRYMIGQLKIHEQQEEVRNQIANIFIEKFSIDNIGNGEDLVNLQYEVEKVLSK